MRSQLKEVEYKPDYEEVWSIMAMPRQFATLPQAIESYDSSAIKPDYYQAWYSWVMRFNLQRYPEAIESLTNCSISARLLQSLVQSRLVTHQLQRYEEAIESMTKQFKLKK